MLTQTGYNRGASRDRVPLRWTPGSTKTCRSRKTRGCSAACWATCCAPRAGPDAAPAIKRELERLLNELPIAQVLDVVRAFSYFSHLVNIAEDVHQNRRRRVHALAGSAPQVGSLAHAFDRIDAAGVDEARLKRWFAEALVSPVLTAHPTEVQRRSILDCEREIARGDRIQRVARRRVKVERVSRHIAIDGKSRA